ncbi:hypothetical protein PPTG_02934 [Phytophthora nicotianae INRA-310]|uniref:BED-type domain-containing protein n=1 Tax=Phytophthora nicotianae (strain INRA-310) TaxID=761204 RepID=W2RFP6_PHYN3|nr:hypothetical protein PPTG_02934 [Phytophthora nicotianae INRA-310]ETN23340.1 hypothetical protein PPTG_02934 [Phytophthora nicotianae INRA-310]
MVNTKDICAFFYDDLGSGCYACRECGTARKQQVGSGYSNLMSHITTKHPQYEEMYSAATSSGTLQSFGFVSQETNHRFQWLRWFVERNLPISEVDNDVSRSMSKWPPISSKALKACMHTVAKNVGVVIDQELGVSFGLMFDGWSHGSMHYIGLYGVYDVMGARRERLLSLSPLGEGGQSAEAHVEMIRTVLDVYNKTTAMVAFIVGDNCNTNQKIATLLGVPLPRSTTS